MMLFARSDLAPEQWASLADILRGMPETNAREVAAAMIGGLELLARGEDWPIGRAQAASLAAWGAAYEAKDAGDDAAYWAAKACAFAGQGMVAASRDYAARAAGVVAWTGGRAA